MYLVTLKLPKPRRVKQVKTMRPLLTGLSKAVSISDLNEYLITNASGEASPTGTSLSSCPDAGTKNSGKQSSTGHTQVSLNGWADAGFEK